MKARIQTWPVAILVMAGLLHWPAPLHAQKKPSFNIAVIQDQRIIRKSKAAVSIRPQGEKLRKDFQMLVRTEERKLRAAERELVNQRSILKPEIYTQRRQKLAKQAQDVQRRMSAKKREIDRALAVAIGKVRKNLREITAAIAKERSISVVLPATAVILFERKYDITAEALKRLDKKLPTIKVRMPSKTKKSKKKSKKK
jgi:Skp family chaperone for outer membrane proteins